MRRTATLGLAPVAPPSSMLSAARAFLDSLTPMPSAPASLICLTLAVATLLGAAIDAQPAVGERRYILATGRRLPYLYVVSLDAALDPANDRTSNAIVSRSKVATEALDGRLLGDPANLVVSEDRRTVYVVNHHGAIDNAVFRQHGGRGQIAVLDVDDLLAPRNNGTANALRRHMDSGGFGALGMCDRSFEVIFASRLSVHQRGQPPPFVAAPPRRQPFRARRLPPAARDEIRGESDRVCHRASARLARG